MATPQILGYLPAIPSIYAANLRINRFQKKKFQKSKFQEHTKCNAKCNANCNAKCNVEWTYVCVCQENFNQRCDITAEPWR